jgi:hypothetical protein
LKKCLGRLKLFRKKLNKKATQAEQTSVGSRRSLLGRLFLKAKIDFLH